MRLGALLPHMQLSSAQADIDISALCYDSRRVQPGALFAAWRGRKQDGHAFVHSAIEQGAAAILCEAMPADVPETVVVLCTPAVRRTLAEAAMRFYDTPCAHLKMVGVTGTNGKTSCVQLIEGMLSEAKLVPGALGTLGAKLQNVAHPTPQLAAALARATGLTTPESVDLAAVLAAMRAAGAKSVTMEASSQALHQQRLAGALFDVAVFTNLTHDHLDYHGDLETYFQAKAALIRTHLKPGGKAVLNVDDARVRTLIKPGFLTFSASLSKARGAAAAAAPTPKADIVIEDVRRDAQGTHLVVQTPRGLVRIDSPLLGAFNTANLLAAVGVGEALGLALDVIAKGLSAVPCVPGRLEAVSRPGEPLVVVDYAHTPDALRQALRAMRAVTVGQLYCVFGCGGDRDPHKRAPMGQAAYHGADWSIITSDNPRHEDPGAIAAAVVGGMQAAGAHHADAPTKGGYCIVLDRGAALVRALRAAGPGDTVLIAGKGHEDYQITGATKRDFDDRVQARHALDAKAMRLTDSEERA